MVNTLHHLKTWPKYFREVAAGNKTFEVRKNDRNFKVGDTLFLYEWDPETKEYTGAQIFAGVTYITALEDIIPDFKYVIMSIKVLIGDKQ